MRELYRQLMRTRKDLRDFDLDPFIRIGLEQYYERLLHIGDPHPTLDKYRVWYDHYREFYVDTLTATWGKPR